MTRHQVNNNAQQCDSEQGRRNTNCGERAYTEETLASATGLQLFGSFIPDTIHSAKVFEIGKVHPEKCQSREFIVPFFPPMSGHHFRKNY